MRLKLLSCILLTLPLYVLSVCGTARETFDEELILKPLKDGKVLAHFQFTTRLTGELKRNEQFSHYGIFPKSIGQIIQHYGVRELHLTFSQGRWNYNGWGYPITQSVGTGLELWAWMYQDDKIEERWKGLTNALSGLFCASLNFIDETITVKPHLSFRPEGFYNAYPMINGDDDDIIGCNIENEDQAELRYGSLPHESVCTENLTPWIKLLPCKAKSGISTLLNAHKLYDTNFHSMAIHVRPICENSSCNQKKTELVQTVTSVFNPLRNSEKRDFSFKSVFDRTINSACPIAGHSKVILILPDDNSPFEVSPNSTQTLKETLAGGYIRKVEIYDLKNIVDELDLEIKWNEDKYNYPLNDSNPRIYAHRYFTGYGQEHGGLTINIFNEHSQQTVQALLFDSIPWFLKLYLHTLKVSVVGQPKFSKDDIVESLYYQPAIDRSRPYLLEMGLLLPPASVITISIEFDKVFLKYTEHRPDANRGFDVGSAVLTTWIINGSDMIAQGGMEYAWTYEERDTSRLGPLYPIRIYTETLLVSLPTPDFSMPYNVITLTCTVIALFFGCMFNLVTRQFVVVESAIKQVAVVDQKNVNPVVDEGSNASK